MLGRVSQMKSALNVKNYFKTFSRSKFISYTFHSKHNNNRLLLFLKCFNLIHIPFPLRFKEDGVVKYLEPAKELISPEHSTLEVTFDDVDEYNQVLSTTIVEEYYR